MMNLTTGKFGGMPSPRVVLSALSVVVLFLCGTRAQSPAAAEYQVKAAFFYNFAKFVEWPPSNFSDVSAPLQICVFSRDPFGEELQIITKENTVNGHRLEIHRVLDLQVADLATFSSLLPWKPDN